MRRHATRLVMPILAMVAVLSPEAAGDCTGDLDGDGMVNGTDLGLIKTKAVPQADGSYKITGQKIWISAGEHDMADNIVHLVLARIEGAPAGVKGISLFVVPKFHVKADGSLGERNFQIIMHRVDDIFLASETRIIEAMRLLWTRLKKQSQPQGMYAILRPVSISCLIASRSLIVQKTKRLQ